MPAPFVLSVQSQVLWGHVGNSAAAFALQRLGFEVLAAPTVLLAHHPGHGRPAGFVLPAAELGALLDGLGPPLLPRPVAGLISGYLGTVENGEAMLAAWGRVKAADPRARFLCDPVIGEREGGVYVRPGLVEFFRDRALPAADIICPNHFELEQLAGERIETLEAALDACRRLCRGGPRIAVCTSLLVAETPAGEIDTLAVSEAGAWAVRTPRLERPPHGSGDLFAALLFGHLLQGVSLPAALARAVAATFAVLKESDGEPEMRLIEMQAILGRPPAAFAARRLA
ncbi:MAG: pyridoxal kinase [Alphaproteobacteria bacterium]|nr:pyridoxal kinase [Alphaproteobacteria bacterium]